MSHSSSNGYLEIALLGLLSLLWGASFTMIDVAVETIPPATIVAGRLAIGSALLLVMAVWRGAAFPRSPAR